MNPLEITNVRGCSFFVADTLEEGRCAKALVMSIDSRHGAMIDAEGMYHCAPVGTPVYWTVSGAIHAARQLYASECALIDKMASFSHVETGYIAEFLTKWE